MNQTHNATPLSKSTSNALRIIFELMVLFHHLYATSTVFGEKIDGLAGVVAVGGFLILSGYGVGVSFLAKGDGYRKKIVKNRIPNLYAIILIADLLYLWLHFYTGNTFDNFFDLIISVLYLPIFNGFVALSHYIYFLADLIIYYTMFWLFSRAFRNEKNPLVATAIAMLVLDLIIIAVLTVINMETGSNRHLRACLCFPLGLLLAEFLKDESSRELFKELKWTLVTWLFIIGTSFYALTDNASLTEYVLPILFAFAIIIAFFGVEIKSKAVDYCSQLVLYVYASHEFFRELFKYCYPSVTENVRALIVVIASVIVAIIIRELVINLADKNEKPILIKDIN